MKKSALFIVAVLLLGSCSLFEKPSMTQEEIDVMVAENAKLQEDLVNAQHQVEMEKMRANECAEMLAKMQEEEEAIASGNYHVIAGSFKVMANAQEFSGKIINAGGSGAIIPGPSDFSLVAKSSHTSLREAVAAMEKARMGDSPEAWVYMQK